MAVVYTVALKSKGNVVLAVLVELVGRAKAARAVYFQSVAAAERIVAHKFTKSRSLGVDYKVFLAERIALKLSLCDEAVEIMVSVGVDAVTHVEIVAVVRACRGFAKLKAVGSAGLLDLINAAVK